MKIDIILEPDLTPEEICDLGLLAESYGVDSVWTSNYFSHWDTFISLTQLANQSRKIKLGILAVSPFEMHPLKIANSLLTLNEISQGRAQIAVGAGEQVLQVCTLTGTTTVHRWGALPFFCKLLCMSSTCTVSGTRIRHSSSVSIPAHEDWFPSQCFLPVESCHLDVTCDVVWERTDDHVTCHSTTRHDRVAVLPGARNTE